MRHFNTIFRLICIMIILVASFLNRNKLKNAYMESRNKFIISMIASIVVALVLFGVITYFVVLS